MKDNLQELEQEIRDKEQEICELMQREHEMQVELDKRSSNENGDGGHHSQGRSLSEFKKSK